MTSPLFVYDPPNSSSAFSTEFNPPSYSNPYQPLDDADLQEVSFLF
jgi:hypothetical protein